MLDKTLASSGRIGQFQDQSVRPVAERCTFFPPPRPPEEVPMQPRRAIHSGAVAGNTLAGGFERLPLDGRMPSGNPVNFLHPDHVFNYPLLGARFKLREGLVRDLIHHYDLERLLIRQLQFLHAIPVRDDLDKKLVGAAPHTFPHSRLLHSIITAYLMAETTEQNGFELPECNLLTTIGLMHDAATIAGGDAFKPFALELFDEEPGLVRILKRRGAMDWEAVTRRHVFPSNALELVLNAVNPKNGDTFGVTWLDLADVLSYLCLDIQELLASIERGEWKDQASVVHQNVFQLLKLGDPLTLWQHVAAHGAKAVVTDTRRLHSMLLIRAWMWRSLYNHPEHRWLEHAIAELMGTYLFQKRIITTGDLLQWTDTDLHRKVQNVLRVKDACSNILLFKGMPRSHGFTSLDEAWRTHERLCEQGALTILVDTDKHPAYITVSPKTKKYYVLDSQGQPVTYAEAHPAEAIAIQHAASYRAHARYTLYYVLNPQIPPSSAAWKAHRVARHQWRVKMEAM